MNELIKNIAEHPFASFFLAFVICEILKIISKCIK